MGPRRDHTSGPHQYPGTGPLSFHGEGPWNRDRGPHHMDHHHTLPECDPLFHSRIPDRFSRGESNEKKY